MPWFWPSCSPLFSSRDVNPQEIKRQYFASTILPFSTWPCALRCFQSVSKQKMFESCFHSLSYHAATFYRFAFLRSLNSDLQERLFNTCNDITKTTSNRQAKVKWVTFSCVYRLSLKLSNSPHQISKQWIEKHQHAWQTHLERIADILLCGEGV